MSGTGWHAQIPEAWMVEALYDGQHTSISSYDPTTAPFARGIPATVEAIAVPSTELRIVVSAQPNPRGLSVREWVDIVEDPNVDDPHRGMHTFLGREDDLLIAGRSASSFVTRYSGAQGPTETYGPFSSRTYLVASASRERMFLIAATPDGSDQQLELERFLASFITD